MTTQKIDTAISTGSPQNSKSVKGVQSGSADLTASFTDVISQTVSAKTQNSTGSISSKDLQKASQKSSLQNDTAKTSEASGRKDDSGNGSSRKVNAGAESGTKADKASDADRTDQTSSKDTDDKISSAEDEIRQKIKDELGVSDEDLKAAMETLGLTNADLLNPQIMPKLAAQLTGNDISAVITDEKLYGEVQNIQAAQIDVTGSLLQELNMTPQEFKKALQTAVPDAMSGTENENTQNIGDTGSPETERQDGKTVYKAAVQDDTPGVTVTDERPIKDSVRTPAEAANLNGNGTASSADTTVRKSAEDTDGTDIQIKVTDNVSDKNDSKSDNGSSLLHSGQNPGTTIFQNLADSVNAAVNAADETVSYSETSLADAKNIMDQITSQVKVALKSDSTSMEMQLNPESLGKLSIQVVSKNGAVTAQFEAQNASVKSVLENQVAELKQTLENQGIRVEHVEVTVASHQFEQNMMNNGNQDTSDASSRKSRTRRINLSDAAEGIPADEDTDDGTKIAKSMMQANGNSIDYTA